ncbi:MAG: N-acetylmuramic acid 6-phosphate etherase [Phycisphaeraceae bacterium]|nr:N-acetylmuramic acid 6-phosphate etherase [Phycisphaeraceae bacterium]
MATPTPHPPDRSHVLTEQHNPRSAALHRLSTRDVVRLINAEDRSVPDAVAAAGDAIAAFIEDVIPRFSRGGRLVYFGAGTSGRLGVLDASECPPTFQTPPERVIGLIAGGDGSLRKSSEGREDEPHGISSEFESLRLGADDAVLGIAAGGTTPYVLGGLHLAASMPSRPLTGLLVCSPMERPLHVDHLIVVATGAEVLTGSTRMKAGTATKLVLNTISTTLMVRTGRVYRNLMVDLRATNHKLRDRAARIISSLTGLGRDDSFALLDRAGGCVKPAIVMHRLGLTRDQSEAVLDRHGGRLDLAIGD